MSALVIRAFALTTARQSPKQNFCTLTCFFSNSRFGLYLAEAGECQQGVVFLNSKGKTSTCTWSGRRRYLSIFFYVTIYAHVDLQILL